jgi:broad specificity phosphatase PhoE
VIADECRVPDVRILHSLVNVDYGEWEGMTSEEASMYDPQAFKLYSEHPEEAVCPNGERLADAQARMFEAIRLIESRHRGERVAAVTHAVTIRLVVAKLLGTEGRRWRIPVGRGSLTTFALRDGTVALKDMPAGEDVD